MNATDQNRHEIMHIFFILAPTISGYHFWSDKDVKAAVEDRVKINEMGISWN